MLLRVLDAWSETLDQTTSWKWFAAVVGCAFVVNIWAINGYPDPLAAIQEQAAAWQAIGSVGAILVAVWVAQRQGEQARSIANTAQRQTEQIALEARRQTERHVDLEAQRFAEQERLGKERAAIWISLVLFDVIQEADKVAQINVMGRMAPADALIHEAAKSELKSRIRRLRFAHADAAGTLTERCEKLSTRSAHEVMRTLRYLGHYNAHLGMVLDAVDEPGTYYSTVARGVQLRYEEAIRIRESGKSAYDAVQGEVPAVRPRAEIFASENLRHLASPPEHVE